MAHSKLIPIITQLLKFNTLSRHSLSLHSTLIKYNNILRLCNLERNREGFAKDHFQGTHGAFVQSKHLTEFAT